MATGESGLSRGGSFFCLDGRRRGGRAEFRHLDGAGCSDLVLTPRAGCVLVQHKRSIKTSPHEELSC